MFRRLLSNTHQNATRTVQRAVSTPNKSVLQRAQFTNVLPFQHFVKARNFSSTNFTTNTTYFQHNKYKAHESIATESTAPIHLARLGITGVFALSGVLLPAEPAEMAENCSEDTKHLSIITADSTAAAAAIRRIKNNKNKFDHITKLVEQGDANAQFNLAGMYYTGKGLEEDHERAVELLTLAAEQGHVGAQNKLDSLFLKEGQKLDELYVKKRDIKFDLYKKKREMNMNIQKKQKVISC